MQSENGIARASAKRFNGKLVLLVGIVLVFSIIVNSINPKFLTGTNLLNILYQYSVVGVMAVGMTMIILTGGIDLSMGYGVAFGTVVCGIIFTELANPALAVIGGILACTLVGFINGIIITKLHIVPFVTTLATMSLVQGALNLVGSGKRIMLQHDIFDLIGKTDVLGVSVSSIIMFVIMLIGAMILNNTKLGSYIYAIGSNEKNATLAGINTEGYKIAVYAIGGLCTGIASILLGSKLTLVTQSSAGPTQLMDTIAAVILGGTSMAGGAGKMSGTLVGVLLLGIIGNSLTLLNVPAVAQDLFKGLVIILALLLNTIDRVLGVGSRGRAVASNGIADLKIFTKTKNKEREG